MSTPTTSDFFSGKVQQREYNQFIAVEVVSGVRHLYVSETVEQVFDFEGLTYDLAHYTGPITVTDVEGVSYTFTPAQSYDDGSSGYGTFAKEQVTVSRSRMSPHLWRLEVVRRGSRLLDNGTEIIAGPTWAFPTGGGS